MLFVPESQQISDRFAGEIDDLRTIGRLHGLPTGSAEHLIELPLRLSQDSRLRSDLTEMVRSLQGRDPEFGLPDALSLFVVAVGGPSAIKRARTLEEPVDLIGGFLASLGGWPGSSVEPLLDLDHPPDHDPRLDPEFSSPVPQSPGSPRMVEEVQIATGPGSQDPPAVGLQGSNLAEINNALARLERGNLELRLHLDSIDQRICRMEPLLESVPHAELPEIPERESAASMTPPRQEKQTDLEQPAPAEPSRVLLSPEFDLPEDTLERDRNLRRLALSSAFTEPIPTAPPPPNTHPSSGEAPVPASRLSTNRDDLPEYPEYQTRHSRAVQPRRDRFAAAREIPGNSPESDPLYTEQLSDEEKRPLPAASVHTPELSAVESSYSAATRISSREPAPATAFVPARPAQTTPEEEFAKARFDPEPAEALIDDRKLFGTAESLAQSTADPDAPRSKRPWIAGLAAAATLGAAGFLYLNGVPGFATHWLAGDGSRPAATATEGDTAQAPSEGEGTPAATAPLPAARPGPVAKIKADQSSRARASSTAEAPPPLTSPPTFVPIMDGHLLAAPRPEYPTGASLAGVSGRVTMDVMISRAGSVEALKVLGGPRLLQDAAATAVRQWQYQPYLVKGRPVEVRTIVRLDVGPPSGANGNE